LLKYIDISDLGLILFQGVDSGAFPSAFRCDWIVAAFFLL